MHWGADDYGGDAYSFPLHLFLPYSRIQLLGPGTDPLPVLDAFRKRARDSVRVPRAGPAHGHKLLHSLPGHR